MEFVSTAKGSGGFLSPQNIVKELDIIKEGMTIADFGCGHGYFTLPLSEKVGEDGKVFAIDVSPEALEVVNLKLKIDGKENVETKRCNLEKAKSCDLKEEFCDIIFIVNLFFQTEKDDIIVKEAKRFLKKQGAIVFIDWQPEVSLGPQGKRLKKEEVIKMFQKEGFQKEKEFPTDNYHYGLIFKKT